MPNVLTAFRLRSENNINVDNPAINIISVCSGVAGLDLGVGNAFRSIGITPRTIAYVEREAFACAVLEAHMDAGELDAAPIWADLSDFPIRYFADCTDMVIGGIPCQDFSYAGQRAGTDGDRWLWPDFWRIVKESRAKMLFIENVPGFISGGGLHAVLSDLAASGWDAQWDCFTAEQVGAPHKRERFFLLAYSDEFRRRAQCDKWPQQQGRTYAANAGAVMADAISERLRRWDYGDTPRNNREIQTPGSCGSMAHASEDVDATNPRTKVCAGAYQAGSMGDACGAGREGHELGGTRLCNGCGTEAHGSTAESGEIPVWPPGPGDREEWERVIAMRPDLAPAIDGKLNTRFVNWLMGLPECWTEILGAARIDQLRVLGNAVVPATAELAFMTLWCRARET